MTKSGVGLRAERCRKGRFREVDASCEKTRAKNTYDNADTRTQKSKGPTQETWTYQYDLHNHLVRVEKFDAVGGNRQLRIDYVYDALGNRIRRTVSDGSLAVVEDQKFAFDGWDTIMG